MRSTIPRRSATASREPWRTTSRPLLTTCRRSSTTWRPKERTAKSPPSNPSQNAKRPRRRKPRPSTSRRPAVTGLLLEGHVGLEVAILPADRRLLRMVLAEVVAELGDHGETRLAFTLAIGRDHERLAVPGLDLLAE